LVVDENGLHDAETVDVETFEKLDTLEILSCGVSASFVASESVTVETDRIFGFGEEKIVVNEGVSR
jgi:hypothetical protein